jgi:hypothetical protein
MTEMLGAMGVKVKKERADKDSVKEKNKKCGCCGDMFVTLARHYGYTPHYGEGGKAAGPVNKPSRCAAWAIKNKIDPAAQSIAKSPVGKSSRVGQLKAVQTLINGGSMTVKQSESIIKMIDKNYPEVVEAEEAEEEEEVDEEEKA